MGIPLIALTGRQPQIQSPQDVANAAVNLSRNRTAAQSEQLDVQQKQQALQDQKTIMATLSANKGDIEASLPQLAGKITPQAYTGLAKFNLEQRKTHAEIDDKELAVKKDRLDRLTALHQQASQIPDEQYAQQWPMIAAAANQIDPKLNLNPQQPIPKDQLEGHGIGLMVEDQYLKREADKRAAAKSEQELQEGKIKMTGVELSLAGQALGAAKSQEDWDKGRALLKQRITGNAFAQIPAEYSPQAVEQVKQQGISPEKAASVPVDRLGLVDWLKKNPGKGPSDYVAWRAKQSPAAIVMGNMLTGDALDQAAERYAASGELAPGFARSPGTTKAILDRAAQLHKGESIAENKAEYKANVQSLGNLQKQFDAVSAFEQTAIKNLNQVLDAGKAIPDLGTRFANVPVRMISEKSIGTPEMARFRAALLTAQTESAKVLNSANATGVLSDSARKELEEMFSGNLPYKSMVAVVKQLETDMGNRHESYGMQLQDIKGRIGGKQAKPNTGTNEGEQHPFFSQFGGTARKP